MELQRAQSGQPLEPEAGTWNAFCDATDDFFRRQGNRENPPDPLDQRGDIVLVRNDTGADRYRFEHLGLGDIIVGPTQNLHDFINRIAFAGELPADRHFGRWGLLLDDCLVDKMARMLVGGVTAVRVQMFDELHRFADVNYGRCDALSSSASGAAQLLYIQPPAERPTADVAWCIARIGLPVAAIPIVAAVVECDYDDITHSLTVVCVPVRGTNFSYDPEDVERYTAWAGIDTLIVADDLVLLKPIRPMETAPEIRFQVEAMLSVPRNQLDIPDMDCLTAYTEPCQPAVASDICVW